MQQNPWTAKLDDEVSKAMAASQAYYDSLKTSEPSNTFVDINEPVPTKKISRVNNWSNVPNAYGSRSGSLEGSMANLNMSQNAASEGIPQAQQNIGMQTQEYNQLAAQPDASASQTSVSYPTFANTGGIGTGVPFGQSQNQNSQANADPLSRIGVYELKGQANTR